MILRNYHTHSTYCDGKDNLEDIVKSAISQGFATIGFSGHSPLPNENWTMTSEGMKEYCKEVLVLKEKYRHKIEVLLGLEQDIFSEPPSENLDFIIGSVHGIKTPDGILYMDSTADILKAGIEKHFAGDALSLAEKYYELVGEIVNLTNADIIAHLDLLTKFDEKEENPLFDQSNPRYINAVTNAVKKLASAHKKPLFEINTGAIARGYRTTPYPSKAILKIIKDAGCDVVISSDCHDMRQLSCSFDEAVSLAESCGFERLAYLSQGKIEYEYI
ncbi:MAG: histidinol-phosphatase [Eubacteriales bacterium]|nr:histidinol-phosphatase [Eubacteriales bacterium]